MSEIYDLKLHEAVTVSGNAIQVTRVPGGWIYEMVPYNSFPGGSVFVPLDFEFKSKNIDKF